MPTQLPSTCTLGAILPRADPRDALVMAPRLASTHKSLSSLPAGSIVGTSSVRRSAQIARLYPHLRFANVRGNVGTRLAKLDTEPTTTEQGKEQETEHGESEGGAPVRYSCLILAAAGLERLGLGARITQYLDSRHGGLLHAVGQGALGVEIRAGDERVQKLLEPLADRRTGLACLAERSLMRTLEGGCSVPIGVETEWVSPNEADDERRRRRSAGEGEGEGEGKGEEQVLLMRAMVVSLDGQDHVQGERRTEVRTSEQADEFGWSMASDLVQKGAARILETINLNRDVIEKQDGA
ncbi:MAG: porphobilinogen deaminase [Pleopsidium flavum]|nr:MAG: porphobilinogen deaminase [Pleopsidium flavum]